MDKQRQPKERPLTFKEKIIGIKELRKVPITELESTSDKPEKQIKSEKLVELINEYYKEKNITKTLQIINDQKNKGTKKVENINVKDKNNN